MKTTRPLLSHLLILVFVSAGLTGCALLGSLAGTVQTPDVKYKSMKFDALSFDGVTMLFDFEVDNPNRLNLSAKGYSYSFSVSENPFLSGRNDDGLELRAQSASIVTVPVRFGFREAFDTVTALASSDSIAYGIESTFRFEIPVLGVKEVPVSASGWIPVPKMPRLSLQDISIRNLSFTGAEINVRLQFENPNVFGMSFSDVEYDLSVDGTRWASAGIRQSIIMAPNETQTVDIPVRLDLGQLGLSVYRMLSGQQAFNYAVSGSGNVKVDLPYFADVQRLPFNLNGRYSF
jgi:LEA14-like dessication related protein